VPDTGHVAAGRVRQLSSVECFSASLRGGSFLFTPWLTTLIDQAGEVGQYLAAGPQVDERYAFATTDTATEVVDATSGLVTGLARGFTIAAPGTPDPRWHEVTVDVADDRLLASVRYSPLLASSEVVESLLPSWLDTVDRAATRDATEPDERIDLTIRRSVPEIVSAPPAHRRGSYS
jgi:hypothetical protein